MKLGPLDLPVANANQIVGFAVLLLVLMFVLRRVPVIPAQFRP